MRCKPTGRFFRWVLKIPGRRRAGEANGFPSDATMLKPIGQLRSLVGGYKATNIPTISQTWCKSGGSRTRRENNLPSGPQAQKKRFEPGMNNPLIPMARITKMKMASTHLAPKADTGGPVHPRLLAVTCKGPIKATRRRFTNVGMRRASGSELIEDKRRSAQGEAELTWGASRSVARQGYHSEPWCQDFASLVVRIYIPDLTGAASLGGKAGRVKKQFTPIGGGFLVAQQRTAPEAQ